MAAFPSSKRAVVCQKCHLQCWLVNTEPWQAFRMILRADCLADINIVHACNRHDITSFCFLDFHPLQATKSKQFADAERFLRTVFFQNNNQLPDTDGSPDNTSDTNPSHIIIVIQKRYLELQGLI